MTFVRSKRFCSQTIRFHLLSFKIKSSKEYRTCVFSFKCSLTVEYGHVGCVAAPNFADFPPRQYFDIILPTNTQNHPNFPITTPHYDFKKVHSNLFPEINVAPSPLSASLKRIISHNPRERGKKCKLVTKLTASAACCL